MTVEWGRVTLDLGIARSGVWLGKVVTGRAAVAERRVTTKINEGRAGDFLLPLEERIDFPGAGQAYNSDWSDARAAPVTGVRSGTFGIGWTDSTARKSGCGHPSEWSRLGLLGLTWTTGLNTKKAETDDDQSWLWKVSVDLRSTRRFCRQGSEMPQVQIADAGSGWDVNQGKRRQANWGRRENGRHSGRGAGRAKV